MADTARRATYGTPDLLLNASHDGNDEGLPLSVPVEGVQAWELHGSPDDHVRLSPAYVLQPVHTIAAWVRLDTRVQGFKPLLAGGNDALVLSPELRPGIIAANGTISRFADSEPLPRNEWLMIVGVGQSRGVTSSQGHFGETRFYVGRARDANLVEAGAVELCAAGLSCSHVSTPTSAFGSVAELAIWDRAVPLDELRSLFASRRGEFGCRCATGATVLAAGLAAAPPPARLWFAPPAGGLVGEVVDAASCAAVDGVDVCLDGAVLATTDALGRFSLSAVPAGTLAFCKAGYAPALHAAHGVMRARLLRADASQRFAAREGVELCTPAGAVLVVAPGSLCTADDGVPFDGEACAALTILDATAPSALHSMPGDFTALGAKGEACQLESFGAAHIALADGAGRELRVRDGAPPLEVRMATAAALHYEKLSAPPSLWAFDAAQAKWVQAAAGGARLSVDGVELPAAGAAGAAPAGGATAPPDKIRTITAKKKKAWDERRDAWTPERFARLLAAAPGGAKQLRLRVRRAGWWNVDAPYHGSLLSLRVLTPAGEPVAAAMVYAAGVDYHGRTVGKTDPDGRVSLLAQFASRVSLDVQLADAAGADGLPVQQDDWLHPAPPTLPQVRLGTFGTGAAPGTAVELGEVKLNRAAAAA